MNIEFDTKLNWPALIAIMTVVAGGWTWVDGIADDSRTRDDSIASEVELNKQLQDQENRHIRESLERIESLLQERN